MEKRKDDFDVALGIILRKARNERRYSLEYVAKRVGLTRQMMSIYELGSSTMSARLLLQLCSIYGIDIDKIQDQIDEIQKGTDNYDL